MEEDINDLESNLGKVNYNDKGNYGNCMLMAEHKKRDTQDIYVPGIIRSGLCYTEPLIPPEISADHPKATIYNSPELLRRKDKEFDNQVNEETLKFIYNYQETK